MTTLGQILGLKPLFKERISEAAARDAAVARVWMDGTEALPEVSRELTWDASGRAVWRFCWSSPVSGAPDLVVDVDAASGTVVRAGMPLR